RQPYVHFSVLATSKIPSTWLFIRESRERDKTLPPMRHELRAPVELSSCFSERSQARPQLCRPAKTLLRREWLEKQLERGIPIRVTDGPHRSRSIQAW